MTRAPTLVSIGSSTDVDYDFLVPITALFWRDLIGHHPRVFLVGDEQERKTGRLRVSLEALRFHGIDSTFVTHLNGYQDATVAQNVRQHAAVDPAIPDDQWIMMSDADLWPLRREFYHQHVDRSELAVCYYANGDHFRRKESVLKEIETGKCFQSIPTCHVTLRAREWRTIYDLIPGELSEGTKITLDRTLKQRLPKARDPGLMTWCSDQWFMTEKLCRQDWFPERAWLITRRGHPPLDRYDRGLPSLWGRFKPIWTDAHLPKNPVSEWKKIKPIIDCLLPQHATWAQRYRNAYVAQ